MKMPWEMAGDFKWTEKVWHLNAESRKFLPANPTRVVFMLWTVSAGGLFFFSTDGSNQTNKGFMLPGQTALPFIMSFDKVGPLVQAEWWMHANAEIYFTVWEVIMTRNPCNGQSAGNVQLYDASGNPV